MSDPKTILIVDDDPLVIEATRRALAPQGYALLEARSGAEALQAVRDYLPDLVLLDVVLPDVDGTELCRQIKVDPALRNTYVVLLSAIKIQSDDQAMGLEAGADGYIVRPIPNRELAARVEAFLRIKTAEDALRKSEELYRLLAETTRDIILLHDMQGRILYVNQAGLELAGFELSEALGKPVTAFVPPEYIAVIEEHHRQRADGDASLFRYEAEFVNRAGQRIPVEVNSIPVLRDGRPEAVLIVARDITERKRAEEQIRFQASLVENASDAIIATDLEYHVLSWNAAAEAIYGWTASEVLGQPIGQFLRTQFIDDTLEGSIRAVHEKGFWRGEVIQSRKDGTTVPILASVTLLCDRNGNPQGLIAVNRDITERKEAEQKIRESEETYRNLFHNAQVGLFRTRISDGKILESNDQLARMFGYDSREEFIAEYVTSQNYVDPGTRERMLREIREKGTVQNFQARFYRKDGSIFWAQFSARIYPEKGWIEGVAEDITERKQMEEERARLMAELRAQSQQMTQILATVPSGVLLLDGEGRVLQANPVAESHLALLAGVGVGDTLARLGDRSLASLLTSPPVPGLWHEVKAGERTFEVIARPVKNGPQPEQWVVVINDVTQERETQAQLQRQAQLAVVGQLAAGIAHDFNNILGVISLYAQMGLSAPDLPADLRERLQVISQQSALATKLIQQILDFGRRAVLERRPMDLLPFMNETVNLLERTLPENIRVRLTCGQDEYTVNADPTRLQQAIMNLAVNARDAMLPQGGGELRIDLSRIRIGDKTRCQLCGSKLEGEWVRIAVTDNGSGIPPEVFPHLFEPFFTTKEGGQGTGLGLPQVYGIVKQHDGHIEVSTQMGQGSTFTIYLPVLQVRPVEAPLVEREPAVRGECETVLVVEDNPALRKALARTLEMLNYRALQAASGAEALEILEQHADEVALVLSDLVMPEMGGQALFYAMQERGLNIPVVMLSGHPMENELRELQEHGLAGWMLKPPSIEQLGQVLARVLGKNSSTA